MEGYFGRRPGTAYGKSEPATGQTLDQAGDFLRRLIPFPGSETLSPFSLMQMPVPSGAAIAGPPAGPQSNPVDAASGIIREQTASIVSQAASILDEEMARGVLDARSAGSTAPYGRSDASNPVLRQMHELVNNVAALWPSLQNPSAQWPVGSQPAASDADALAEVRPRATVRPGERATISMTLCNSESRSVRLVPAATDLLGSRGGRIECSLLQLTPSELKLEPQEKSDLTIATTVPVDAAPGCYSGLLVVRGLDYLRALITIEVV